MSDKPTLKTRARAIAEELRRDPNRATAIALILDRLAEDLEDLEDREGGLTSVQIEGRTSIVQVEAADEIVRLRAQLDQLREELGASDHAAQVEGAAPGKPGASPWPQEPEGPVVNPEARELLTRRFVRALGLVAEFGGNIMRELVVSDTGQVIVMQLRFDRQGRAVVVGPPVGHDA